MSETSALHPGFGEATRTWFARAFAAPTLVQEQAWEAIASGDDTLVVSPTGWGRPWPHSCGHSIGWSPNQAAAAGCCTYPRCERWPVTSNAICAPHWLESSASPRTWASSRTLSARAIRTADTPQAERQRMARTPPDILITTPESLFLLLTSRAGAFLKDVETVIVDEIRSVAGSKRGAHLSLSLERLDLLTEQPAR